MKLKGFKKSDGSIAKIYTDPTLTESDSPADAASVKAKDDLLQQGITNNANYAAGLNTRLSELENGAPSIIAPKVTEWLNANVDPTGSAVTVDSSLTIAGSAADAKKTGDEISDLKSDLNYNHTAEQGYVLRATNTGHGNEWAMVGTPTDAQAETAINNWLDDHPEATTTVQDGAITEVKFADSLKLKAIKDYVTPEMYGAKGDGETNDTEAFSSMLEYSYTTGTMVLLNAKTYMVDPLVFDYPQTVNSFTMVGVNKTKSALKLTSEGWFSRPENSQLFNRAHFENIMFLGHNKKGYGFYQYSTGMAKQLKFINCSFELDGVLHLDGESNADNHTFSNCVIETNEYVIETNNPQNVGTSVIACVIVCYGDLIKVLRGGCVTFFGGTVDFLGSSSCYAVNSTECIGLGTGNLDYTFFGTRFEYHGINHGAFIGYDNGSIRVNFIGCNMGVVTTEYNKLCDVKSSNVVSFENCILNENSLFDVSGNENHGIGGFLSIKSCCVGSATATNLIERITITGDTSRVVSTGNFFLTGYSADKSILNDFDLGWQNNKSTSIIPASIKLVSMKKDGDYWPMHNGSYNVTLKLPKGSTICRIVLVIPQNTTAGYTCKIRIASADGNTVYYESENFVFNNGISVDFATSQIVSSEIVLTMTNTSEAAFAGRVGFAYIEYI